MDQFYNYSFPAKPSCSSSQWSVFSTDFLLCRAILSARFCASRNTPRINRLDMSRFPLWYLLFKKAFMFFAYLDTISSSRLNMHTALPGSPCRATRPNSWRSILADSFGSAAMTCSPPNSVTPLPSLMSVPLPAMLVATVIFPSLPASATICASFL